jgi:hypothetical protein
MYWGCGVGGRPSPQCGASAQPVSWRVYGKARQEGRTPNGRGPSGLAWGGGEVGQQANSAASRLPSECFSVNPSERLPKPAGSRWFHSACVLYLEELGRPQPTGRCVLPLSLASPSGPRPSGLGPSGPLQYPTATAGIPRTTPPSWILDLTAPLCLYTDYFSYIMSLRHGCSSVSSTQALFSAILCLCNTDDLLCLLHRYFSQLPHVISCHCNMGALLCLLCLLHRHSSQLSYVSATQMLFCVFYTGYLSYLISLQYGCSSVSIHRLDFWYSAGCVTTRPYCFDLLCVSTFLLLCSRSQFCSFYLLLSI